MAPHPLLDGLRFAGSSSRRGLALCALAACIGFGTARGTALDSVDKGVNSLNAGGLQTIPPPTWYVDNTNPAATDAGPGTVAIPHRTISAAIAQHGAPGNRVRVLAGTYPEQITLPVSGTSGSPFVVEAANPSVTVDGADDFSATGSWTLVSGNVWLARSVNWTPKQVFVDGTRLAASTANPSSLPTRTFRYVSGTGLYVNAGGGNPGTHGARVGRRANGFVSYARSWVSVRGFTVARAEDRGIVLGSGTHDLEVVGCRVSDSGLGGIQLNGCTAVRIAGGSSLSNGDHGISLGSSTGCMIEDNEFASNLYAPTRQANGIDLFGSSGNRILRNRFHHNQDTGLNIRGSSNTNVCVGNISWSNGDHGYDTLTSTGNVHLNEVAYGNYNDGFSIEGGATGTQLYNCIAVDNGLTTAGYDLWVDSGSVSGFASNHNLFWNSNSVAPVKYVATVYSTVSAYVTASGRDAQSIQADPRFVNAPGADFHVLAGSPVIDCGNSSVANWPPADSDGRGRYDDPSRTNSGAGAIAYSDRGAFEYGGGPPPPDSPPVVTAPATRSVNEGAVLTISVSVADPNGDPVTSLTADLSGLPTVNNAVFTPGAGNTTGTLTWTPTYEYAGNYLITFRAVARGVTSQAATAVTVVNVDRAPVVTAPASVRIATLAPLTVNVTANDPDGNAITSLTADLATLPTGHTAVFTPGAGNTTGTLRWTPRTTDRGNFNVVFRASNASTGSATTQIRVTKNLNGGGEASAMAASEELSLSAAWPNPTRDRVAFTLGLPAASAVQFAIFDLQGRAVWSESTLLPAGRHSLVWNGRSAAGSRLGAGLYLARMSTGHGTFTRRFVKE